MFGMEMSKGGGEGQFRLKGVWERSPVSLCQGERGYVVFYLTKEI